MRYLRLAPSSLITLSAETAPRCVTAIINTEDVGLDNHIVLTRGLDTSGYMATGGAILFAHKMDEPPVARMVSIGTDGTTMVGRMQFAEADMYPFADTIYKLVRGGFLNATSIGFSPTDYVRANDPARPGGMNILKSRLNECSVVPVPAKPKAIITARSKGIDTKPLFDWAERALDTGGLAMVPRSELEALRRDAKPVRSRFALNDLTSTGALSGSATRGPFIEDNEAMVRQSSVQVIDDIEERRRRARARALVHGTPSPFESFGHFLRAVVAYENLSVPRDPRLVRAPSGLNENDPTAGGFLVPIEYVDQLIGSIYEEAVIAPLCDRRQTDGLAETRLPIVDETSRANGARWGGAASYWKAEGVQPPETLPRLRSIALSRNKLIALCVASEELIQDVPMLEGHVSRAFASEVSFKLDYSILQGTGAGVPLGITVAQGTITVPKIDGQATGTIVAENIAAMWSRLPAPCRKRAVWIVNEDAEAQFETIAQTPGFAGMYFPAGTGGNPYPLIKGRPVVVAEQCPTLGTPGDIVLADLSQYVIVEAPMRTALSLDVLFNSYQGVFRFTWRGNGAPLWAEPITPFNGGPTRSPYVILAQR
jgi:HK97 family phage major capsid protein/HK97 family phage prohead protease